MKAIGPTFLGELQAAGVPLDGISWGADGKIEYRADVPQSVRDQVATVYEAHNPAPLSQDARAAMCVDGMDRLQFKLLFILANQVRDTRAKLNAEAVARGATPPYTAAEAAQITAVQFRNYCIDRWKEDNP